jgi:hypothetical protein
MAMDSGSLAAGVDGHEPGLGTRGITKKKKKGIPRNLF